MVFLRNNPFIRLLAPLLAGILLQFYFPLSQPYLYGLLFALIIPCILLSVIKLQYHVRYVYGIVLNLLLCSIGMQIVHHTHLTTPIKYSNKQLSITGMVLKPPVLVNTNYKTEIQVEAIKQNNYWTEHHTKIVAYIEDAGEIEKVKAGNTIIFQSQLKNIRSNRNPFGFNYASYMALKNINQTVYINKNNWEIISDTETGIKNKGLNLRSRLITIFEEHNITGNNLAILSALTLGYKNKLDEKVRDAYSGAGAMHVLAVSGLHVGIIYKILEYLLLWMGIFKRFKPLQNLLILILLWAYAVITGLSPSVVRATTMFTFIVAGRIINKRPHIYNSIAASAFIMLLINPMQFFEIGFQLSYLAVIGIVFFYPKINGLIHFPLKIFNWLWSLTAVSIAAQIATFPITLFHFHQFPTYFWVANIAVTLIAAILMFLSIALLLTTKIALLSGIIATLTNFLLNVNLSFVNWVSALPGSLIENISINSLQVALLYLSILSFATWLLTKRYSGIIVLLMSILIFGIIRTNQYKKTAQQDAFCVYFANTESAIQFINNKSAIWLTTNNSKTGTTNQIISDANLYWKTFSNRNYYINEIIDSVITSPNWYQNTGYWSSASAKGFLINTNTYIPSAPIDTLHLDYLIITGNPSFKLSDLPAKINFNTIILDGTVPYWKIKEFESKNPKHHIHSAKDMGAFIQTNNL